MKKYFEPNDRILLNPGMGWVMHTSINKGYVDHNEFEPHPYIQAVALLSTWSKLEPQDGVFDFKDLDDAVEKWSKLGKEIHLRISTDPMIYRDSGEGVPSWVFEQYNVPYQEKVTHGLKAKFPDYLNPTYQEIMFRFVDQLCSRYHEHQQVVQMDLRGYGEWGEWHSGYMHDDIETHVKALRSIIKIWDDAVRGRMPLVLSGSYEWRRNQSLKLHAPQSYAMFKHYSAFDYALTKPNVTFRRDGVGGAIKYYDYELFQEYFHQYGRLPLTTEFFMAYAHQKDKEDGTRGYFPEDAVEEALALHPNFMMLMWDSGMFFEERQDLIAHGLRRMGYRLYPAMIEFEQNEKIITIRHTWKNDAVGRLYEPHGVVFIVEDDQGRRHHVVDEHVCLTPVIESQPKTFVSHLPSIESSKTLKVYVGVKLSKDQSMIQLPLDTLEIESYYLLIEL